MKHGIDRLLSVALCGLCLYLCVTQKLYGQAGSAQISGTVTDPQGAVLGGAIVTLFNKAQGVSRTVRTNSTGAYAAPFLPVGTYRITVESNGFQTSVADNVEVHVGDLASINFKLNVGSPTETVTVEGGAPLVNTEDASVSTIVDRNFVANTPLNGRSFQSLILLTPGVVTNTPQATNTLLGNSGEFSVNGQRTESNYYTVDGVSANIGDTALGASVGSTGSISGATALGTTQSLVSVDALEEFRVSSSTYSAEYGRNPGGQFSFVTRSGTSQWHGTAFDYLRNDTFDANNWFNNFFRKPEPPLRQNDFGGTLAGPILKNRTFFFISYEGLRLTQPQAATTRYVPTAALRQATPAPLQQVLNAFPLPNGHDEGNGLADFIGTWANPASVNAYSVRLDHTFNDRLKVFFRFSDTGSDATVRGVGSAGNLTAPSTLQRSDYTLRTYTFGASSALSVRVANEFRLNYSSNVATINNRIDDFGGAQPVNLAALQGISESNSYQIDPGLNFGAFFTQVTQQSTRGKQRQWNFTDSITVLLGRHQLKFGIDYRRLSPIHEPASQIVYFFSDQNRVKTNNANSVSSFNIAKSYPLITNFSAFAQDEWKVTPRINLSIGLRWEVNPAPGVTKGPLPLTVVGTDNLATMTLAPTGTSLWKTTWYNFAPRLGAAYTLCRAARYETVVRGGAGLFFDTGQQSGAYGFSGPNYVSSARRAGSFPQAGALPPITDNLTLPYGTIEAYPAHLQLPYTIEWNLTVDQALGTSQAASVAYVGSHAGRLLQESQVQASLFNPKFTFVQFFRNGSKADYNALQIQFKRRISRGLNALASYTWGHSLDYGSTGLTFPYTRGNSNFDIRHTFSSAFSYDLPRVFQSRVAQIVFDNWGLDHRLTARSSFPVTLLGTNVPNPATGQYFYRGLDLLPGQPLYLYGSQYPGGREINPSAFANPPAGKVGTAPRNFARGLNAWQMDFAVRRDLLMSERIKLQFRAEAFNILNHPNFGFINPSFGQPTFGQATSTLNSSLGVLSPIYQMGGPRSMQLALKLIF